jgi:anti-sigma-K factor RskA
MHDAIGSAGMLRGWVAIWTEQMLWPLVALAAALIIMIVAEALIAAQTRGEQQKPLTFVASVAHDPPLG